MRDATTYPKWQPQKSKQSTENFDKTGGKLACIF